MLHSPYLLGKVVFWASKILLSPFGKGEKKLLCQLKML
jgi:hypothetical protein